jgi:hypothetical protein
LLTLLGGAFSVELGRDSLTRQLLGNRPEGGARSVHLKDAPGNRGGLVVDLQMAFMWLTDPAIPKGDTPPTRVSCFDPSDSPAVSPLEQLRTLILRQRPSHLKEEPPFWPTLQRVGDDEEFHGRTVTFLRQEELMSQVPREAIRVIADDGANRLSSNKVTELS